MFREPEEDITSQAAAKVDKAAAASRSTIRRESTLRPGRYHAIYTPRSREVRRTQIEDSRQRLRTSQNRTIADADQAELEAEIERLRSRREARSRIRWGPMSENEGNDLDRRQAGEELLRDALQHDRPGQRMRLIRPPRESALRFEVAPSPPLSDTESRTASSRQRTFTGSYVPSPPYVSRSTPDGPVLAVNPVELTTGFAPAQGAFIETDGLVGASMSSIAIAAAASPSDDLANAETPQPDTWESAYPPLRRVGHLSPRPFSFRHDGLGDRQRSPTSSAEDSNIEEDTWETLLTTMEEDEHQPTADSSFTSAVASASTSRRSDSASRSGRSSQTTASSLSDLGRLNDEQPCESDDPQIEPNVPYDPSARYMIRRARQLRRAREAQTPSPSLDEERRTIERMHQMARENIAAAERRTAAAEERLRRIESRAVETEAELTQMQSFIDRLARREDIPGDLWAAAGLSRRNDEGQN